MLSYERRLDVVFGMRYAQDSGHCVQMIQAGDRAEMSGFCWQITANSRFRRPKHWGELRNIGL